VAIGLLPLPGQADFFSRSWPVTAMAPAGEALITFKGSPLTTATAQRVWHTGAFEHLEYARFETNELVVEAVYDTIVGDQTILDYPHWMRSMVDTWNRNRGQAKSWGTSSRVQAWHGMIDYQLYRLQGSNQICAGFSSEWDHSARDSYGRPGKLFFGYMCAKAGQPLAADRVDSILKNVTFDWRFGHTFVRPGQTTSVDPAAVALASGAAGSTTGNHRFPFDFGTHYTESGDSFGN
jgi:hypothetical protein